MPGTVTAFPLTTEQATLTLMPKAGGTFTGEVGLPDLAVSGLTGATSPVRLVGGTADVAPTTGTFALRDAVISTTGKVWVCTAAGTPGTWVQAGAPPVAGTYIGVNERPRSPMQATYGGSFTGPNVVAAAAGGAAVDLPPTQCADITTPMLIPGGATLIGVPGKTVFKAQAGASLNILQNADANGFTIDGVTFDGNKAAVTSGTTGYGIAVVTSTGHIEIRKCLFLNTRLSGISSLAADDVDILDNRFVSCGDIAQAGTYRNNGITVTGNGIRIKRNQMIGCTGFGVGGAATAAGQLSRLVVHDNVMLAGVATPTFGVALGSFGSDCEVTNNYIDGTSDNNIDTGTAVKTLIDGNTCLNGRDGIDCDLGTLGTPADLHIGLVITNNRIRVSARYGIVVFAPVVNATGLIVQGNQIRTTDLHGIFLSNVSRSVISGNTVAGHNANATAGFSGINLVNTSKHNSIIGNICYETRATPFTFGYSDDATCDYNDVSHNDLSGCLVPFGAAARTNDIRTNNRV